MKNPQKSKLVQNLTYAAMAISLITLCAWLSIPLGVGFTLQTLAVFLIASCFSIKISLPAVSAYVFLGIIGVPVFAGFRGGFAALVSPSGGFLIGFILSTVLVSMLRCLYKNSAIKHILILLFAQLICYASGTLWYIYVFCYANPSPFGVALAICVLPFVIPDALKILFTAFLYRKLSPICERISF